MSSMVFNAAIGGTDTSDATATAGDILSGKTAYADGEKLTGTISSKAAQTYNVSSGNQTIAAGQYLAGAQTIRAVSTTNITSANIKAGVTVKVGDSGNTGRIKNVTGKSSVVETEDATAVAADMLSGKTAYVNGAKVTGSIPSKSAQTYTPGTTDQTIAADQYLSGAQTIKGDADLVSDNIKAGTEIFGVTGATAVVDTSDATVTANTLRAGYTAYKNGSKITGTVATQSGKTWTPTTEDQTISSPKFITGTQTIKGDANLTAGNIKSGVDVFGVEGTFTSDADATAGEMLSGKTAYVNGSKVTGNIPSKGAATYNVSSSNQTIAAGQYLSGAQTIRAVTTANITAANIKAGVNVKVGDAGSSGRIKNITGTYGTVLLVTVSGGTATSVTAAYSGTIVSLSYNAAIGKWWVVLPSTGTWTVTASGSGLTGTATVSASSVGIYEASVKISRLPAGYTELQYLQNDGTARISTELMTSGKVTGTVKFIRGWTYNNSEIFPIYGSIRYGAWDGYGFVIGAYIWAPIGHLNTWGGDFTVQKNVSYQIEYTPANNTLLINSNSIPRYGSGTTSFTPTVPIQLFGFYNVNADPSSYPANGYYCATMQILGDFIFYDGNGAETAHFVPAKRNSDNVLGMYDLARSRFFTNAATSGTFTAGPEV